MLATLSEIRNRLARVIDENGSVRDMDMATEAISVLERTQVTKEALEETRLGLHVNNIRRATRNSPLAKRAKNLIKSWQQMIEKRETPYRVQKTRPETPNSLGSSPSPPEPPRNHIIPSRSCPQISARIPRSNTPTFDEKSKRKKDTPDVLVNRKFQSSELKSQKQSLDTGQTKVPNGFKVSSKPQSSVKPSFNPALVSNSDHSQSSVKSQSSKSSLHLSTKLKRSSKNNRKTTSPIPNAKVHETDIYNNNAKIKSSKSAPDFTVTQHPLRNTPSPNERVISASATVSKTQSSLTSDGNLKRRYDAISGNTSSPDLSIDKPRKAKERRLTYDPVTKQLKVPEQDNPGMRNAASQPATEKTPLKRVSPGNKLTPKSYSTMNRSSIRSEKDTETIVSKSTCSGKTGSSGSKKDFPMKICPSVHILGSSPQYDHESYNATCSSSTDFHKLHREFKKRKTRRKEADFMDMSSLYPLSKLVENLDSDSDESTENSFSSTIASEFDSDRPVHSLFRMLPGVTGCRGNNGSWFDWSQMFCVNHHAQSETLPDEKEILPLQILPYVELD